MKYLSLYEDPTKLIESYEIKSDINQASKPYLLINNSVFKFPGLHKISLPSVIWICSNSSISIAVTSDGQVYGWGKDDLGLLGNGIQNYSTPIHLKTLTNIKICALSSNHVAAVSTKGSLYTWGSISHPKLGFKTCDFFNPHLISSCSSYIITSVICGDNYTCLLTDGCYTLIYGEIGQKHLNALKTQKRLSDKNPNTQKNYLPYSHPTLDSQPVLQITGYSDYIGVLLESHEVCVLDSCLNLRKISSFECQVDSIQALSKDIIGIGDNNIIIWSNVTKCVNDIECPIKEWAEISYKRCKNISLWCWGSGFVVDSDDKNVFDIDQTTDYSGFDKSMTRISDESPLIFGSKSIENLSPQASRESLERLFPVSDKSNRVIIDKILKCRVEFSKRGKILDAFKKIVHPIAKNAFFCVKEHGEIKRNEILYRNAVKMFWILEKVCSGRVYKKFCIWQRIRVLLEMKIRIEKQKKGKCQNCREMIKGKAVERFGNVMWCRIKKILKGSLFEIYLKEKKLLRDVRKGFGKIEKIVRLAGKRRLLDAFRLTLYSNKVVFLSKQVFYKHFCKVLALVFGGKVLRNCKYALMEMRKMLALKLKVGNSGKSLLIIDSLETRNDTLELYSPSPHNQTKIFAVFLLKDMITKNIKSKLKLFLPIKKSFNLKTLHKLLLNLSSYIFKKQFALKVFSLTCIKFSSGTLDPFYTIFPKSSSVNFENFKNPQHLKNPLKTHKKTPLKTLSAIQSPKSKKNLSIFTSESSSSSSSFNQTSKSALQSPKSFIHQNPTSFASGDLVKYQKFLIEKKALQMIEENSSNDSYEKIPYIHFSHKTNKKKSEKPPWKPNSPLSNFAWKPKTNSSMIKGIEYYEKIAGRKNKHLVNRQTSEVEDFYKNCVKKTKEEKQKTHKELSKNHEVESLPSLQSLSPVSMLNTGLPIPFTVLSIINIGLGVLINDKLLQNSSKKLYKKAIKQFISYKKTKKSTNPQRSSPSTWKIRIISIGAEKLKRLLMLKIGQFIIKKLKP
ncbi:hypothetical protein SteCoe_8178 [Stentor coeruleus]|uniref:Uncharacterized protein n=1 Tax=Stentor coeruleus TaxID=5963 RepID=A0A1R2CKU9_9CILI|nr:hypothetical protein SteCoe_8178 [Stentor coeruleus]